MHSREETTQVLSSFGKKLPTDRSHEGTHSYQSSQMFPAHTQFHCRQLRLPPTNITKWAPTTTKKCCLMQQTRALTYYTRVRPRSAGRADRSACEIQKNPQTVFERQINTNANILGMIEIFQNQIQQMITFQFHKSFTSQTKMSFRTC